MRPHKAVAELLYETRRRGKRWSRASLADVANELPGAPDGISDDFIRDLEDRLAKMPVKDPRLWFVVAALGIERQMIHDILGGGQ